VSENVDRQEWIDEREETNQPKRRRRRKVIEHI
jgi:hypothetical protein